MGLNEGFAIAARAQLANISAFTDTMSNVDTMISASNNGLQSLSDLAGQVQNAAAQTPQTLDSTGKPSPRRMPMPNSTSMIGILNSPPATAICFPATRSIRRRRRLPTRS